MSQPGRSVIEDVETWSGKGPQDENFPVGSIIIARKYREPMHRYYTFARNADDIANSSKLSPRTSSHASTSWKTFCLVAEPMGHRALRRCAPASRKPV